MSLALQSVNGIQVAALTGALDNTVGADLVTTIKASVQKGATIILDCTGISRMDVAGFKHLLALHRWTQGGDGRLVLAGMSPDGWQLVVDYHCENTFESRPSVPAAFQALGVSQTAPVGGDVTTGASSFDDYNDPGPFVMPSEPVPSAASSAGFPESPPSYTSPADNPWEDPPLGEAPSSGGSAWQSTSTEDAWSSYQDPRAVSGNDAGGGNDGKKGKTKLLIGIAAAVVLLGLGGLWLMLFLRVPEITVSTTSLVVQEGTEPEDVEILVTNGELDVHEIDLPDGLEFGEGNVEGNVHSYYLAGAPLATAQNAEVRLTASRGDRRSEPVELAIKIKPKPMEWLFRPPSLQVGTPISGYTKVVSGAGSVQSVWGSADPGGLKLQLVDKSSVWVISGTPERSGDFQVEFIAKSANGTEDRKSFPVRVEALPPPPEPPAPVPPPLPAPDAGKTELSSATESEGASPSPSPPPSPVPLPPKPAVAGVDDGMRSFLLERIDKANSHFDDDDKKQLRQMVELLTEAREVVTVKFGNNQTSPSASELAKLKAALADPETRKLLEDPDCQILVVGYASTTGSFSRNVKLSQQRAQSVNEVVREKLSRSADLCGDYGPTDILSTNEAGNRAVEVFAGKIQIPRILKPVADRFKEDFNRKHGGR